MIKTVIDPDQFTRTLKRMTHEIIERNDDLSQIILVGIEKKEYRWPKKSNP